ncbi:unnamed protein product [Gongylonema pulchrum]|uniref:CUB domain-containing protein n=1 Tax=Gongylonema pulchrum TaxID=637853 RepID=A0A183D0Q4_9BILA|nr:unnamed protein product [Gongylonema pulchrum]
MLERFCHNLKQPKIVTSRTEQALVTFQGGPYERAYLSGDDERTHNVGFVLFISLACGGTLYAENELKTFQLHAFKEDECRFTIRADDGQHVYLRLDQLQFNQRRASKARGKSAATIAVYDGAQEGAAALGIFHPECNPSSIERASRICSNRELRSTGSAMSVHLRGLNTFQLERVHFSYSTRIESYALKLPFSEYCAESYLEIRENNSSGKIATRACSFESAQPTMTSQSFWLRLRYINEEEDDTSDIEPLKPELMIKFKKLSKKKCVVVPLAILDPFIVFGGVVSGSAVSSPAADDWRLTEFSPIEWTLIAPDEHWIRVSIKDIEIPDERDENNIDVDQRDTLKGLVVSIQFA